MVNITGLIAVVFVFVGVVLLLAIPTVFEWIVRRRFSNRFERLVRQGYVIPLLTRDILKENDRSPPRRRMTMQSLKEAWIRGQPALGAASKDWKPLAAQFHARQDKRPVTAEILTSKAQKKHAKRFLDTFRLKKIGITPQNDGVDGAQKDAVQMAGSVQCTTLILMPSRGVSYQHDTHGGRMDAGPSTSEKGAGGWANGATLSSARHPRSRTLGEKSEAALGDMVGQRTLSSIEIGVAEYNLDQASDILELAEKGEEGESLFSLENDDDRFHEMIRTMATYAPVTRYPIYRHYAMPMRQMSPLTGGRVRVY